MKRIIAVSGTLERTLRIHFFQNEVEQGAFLFARVRETAEELCLEAADSYLVPASAWDVQTEDYLEMADTERAKIMKRARDAGLAVVECHSHPGSGKRVWFSPSDCIGITQFAQYAKWKLDGKPYGATVWGESSIDAVIWHGDFSEAHQVDEVRIVGNKIMIVEPRKTWTEKRFLSWLGGPDAG